jgi:hypothetical protein
LKSQNLGTDWERSKHIRFRANYLESDRIAAFVDIGVYVVGEFDRLGNLFFRELEIERFRLTIIGQGWTTQRIPRSSITVMTRAVALRFEHDNTDSVERIAPSSLSVWPSHPETQDALDLRF